MDPEAFGDAAPAPHLANDPVSSDLDTRAPMDPDSDHDSAMQGVTIATQVPITGPTRRRRRLRHEPSKANQAKHDTK